MTHQVFVYGTLRREGSREIKTHFPSATHVADGVTFGTLYDLGPYPGLRLIGGNKIIGEVYRVDDETLSALDAYEGCYPESPAQSDYHRRPVCITIEDGASIDCWIYEIVESLTVGCPVISAGDWIRHAAEKQAC